MIHDTCLDKIEKKKPKSAAKRVKRKGELCASCWNVKGEWVVKWLKEEGGARVYVCGHSEEVVSAASEGQLSNLVSSTLVNCPCGNKELTASERLKYNSEHKKAQRAGHIDLAYDLAKETLP